VTVEPGAISTDHADRPLVLAVDIGSSSVRAALHDRLGRTLRGTAVQVRYDWQVGPDGSVRISCRALLALVGQALDHLVAVAGPLLTQVAAGGVSCFFHSMVGLDAAGRPITPVLSWADTTSAAAAAALRERVDPEDIHGKTGAPVHASYWPARILRLREEEPDIRRWAGLPELVAQALTGRAVVSRSMASGTGLLERARGTWFAELLELLEVEARDLPAIVGDDEPIGRLSSIASRRWPKLGQVPWLAAWGDGACGNVGLAADGPGKAALMVGTSGAMRAVIADPAAAVPPGLFAFRLGGGTLMGGQLSEGGGLLAWAGQLLRRSRASLERAAAEMGPAAHGLTVLPYLLGERGLGYHDGARAALTGLGPATDAVAIYRALLESIAYSFAAVDERLTEALPVAPQIVAAGGALTRSPLLAQVIADCVGRDIAIAPALEASRRGAALLALQGCGLLDGDALPALRMRVVRHDPDRSDQYRIALRRQQALYASVLA
jgi:gluconokinase